MIPPVIPKSCLGLFAAIAFLTFIVSRAAAADATNAVPITNAVPMSAADQAWNRLVEARAARPEPLKQLPDRMYTDKEMHNYYQGLADWAGGIADMARQFYTLYPDHPQAGAAQEGYFATLHQAVELGGTNRIPELEALTAERLKDPKLNEEARFKISLSLLQSVVSGRQYESDDAMRAELETRARALADQYPKRPEGCDYLMKIARRAKPEKMMALAREVMSRTSDEAIKRECRGLVNRGEAVNHPLDLKLTSAKGDPLNLEKFRGKVVVLLFWDSRAKWGSKSVWVVNNLYKSFHSKGLEVWGLNFDEDTNRVNEVLKDIPVEWPQYLDGLAGRTLETRFGVHTLPMCWFVDKKGVLRELTGEGEEEVITQRLLAEP
jgi:hypothetical protein